MSFLVVMLTTIVIFTHALPKALHEETVTLKTLESCNRFNEDNKRFYHRLRNFTDIIQLELDWFGTKQVINLGESNDTTDLLRY